MGNNGKEAGDAMLASGDGMERSPRMLMRRWLRVSVGGSDSLVPEQLDELEREVALLREENARLKMGREHARDRPVNERVRAAFATLPSEGDPAGDPWEVLTECMLLRDSLVDACRELELGAHELRVRLETLLPNAEGTDAEPRPSTDFEGVA
ncbi:MAG TPA: hypothetical protein VFG31_10655 [Conexibacter sp.]|nr:hypothetical protein [Conexibacter sp.]